MRSVICADDDKHIRTLYENIFSERGFDVRVYPDGSYIMDAFHEQRADLLILDIDMPRKTGLVVCSEMRRDPEGYDASIMIVSSHDTEETIVNALTAGADDYIIKPFKPAELLAKASAVIKKRTLTISKEMGLPVGSLFAGRYEILSKIGSGGFSNVFYAKDKGRKKAIDVALKVFELSPQQQSDQECKILFLREAYGLSKLDHRNIVVLHDFGNSHFYYYLAMEYLKGKSLHEVVKKTGAMRQAEAAMIGYEITKALDYLDRNRTVHRDIKPNNVMIVETGDVKLIDFGMAKLIKDETVSEKGMFTGTPQYAAPELITMQSDTDSRADIFSLGATLYYAVTKSEPYPGDNPREVFHYRFKDDAVPKSLQKIKPTISREFSRLVESMMAIDRGDRPAIKEVKKALKSFI